MPAFRLISQLKNTGDGHIQSLKLAGIFIILGFISFLIALLADLMNFDRQLMGQTLEKSGT
jgi:H+/Cl- antiporter ClcA